MAAAVPTLIAVLTAANQVQNIQEKKKQAKQNSRAAAEKSALLKAEAVNQERERKQRLKTALASQKALFGARGIAASSGTALALANKQVEESKNASALNLQKNALQLNQLNRGGGFSQTRALLGTSKTLLGSLK